MPKNRMKSRLLPFQAHKQQPLRSISTAVFLRFNDFTVFCAEVIVKRMGIRSIIPFCGDLKLPYCCYIESISGANFKGLFVTGSCVSPAQGRQSQWAWTGNRSCRFPGRCGDPHQRRSPSWQEWGCLPRQGFPVRGCGGWRCSRP